MTCHNGRPGPDHAGECYKYLAIHSAASYLNKTLEWIVVLGVSFQGFTLTAADELQWVVYDTAGGSSTGAVDRSRYGIENIAASTTPVLDVPYQISLQKKILIAPNFTFTPGGDFTSDGWHGIQCATLDHAIDIL